MYKTVIKQSIRALFFISLFVCVVFITAVLTRNIYHPKLKSIRPYVLYIADLPKEVYRQFFLGLETDSPILPKSVRTIKFDPTIISNNIIYRHKGKIFENGNQIFENGILSDQPIFFIDSKKHYILSRRDGNIIKQEINENALRTVWEISVPYLHHEIFVDDDGYIYSPTYFPIKDGENSEIVKRLARILAKDNSPPYGKTGDNYRDDGVIVISPEGKIVHQLGLTDLFETNDLLYLLYAFGLETDPFHLNSVYPAKMDNGAIKKGDLLISLRHKSILMIYRPSSLKVIWHQVGPWLNQHSAKFDEKGNIYVFDNNIIETHYSRTRENNGELENRILVFDTKSGKVGELRACIDNKDVWTATGGFVNIENGTVITSFPNTATTILCNLISMKKTVMSPDIDSFGKVIPGTEYQIIGIESRVQK